MPKVAGSSPVTGANLNKQTMTNKEIKFELGKIALTRCGCEHLTESLRNIYEWIIEDPEEEVIPKQPVNDYEQKPIREVYLEIQRIEEAEKEEKIQKGRSRVQKKGHARRFIHVAQYNDIETVGQLVEYDKADFMRLPNIGRQCADYISMALKNLYGIDRW